MKSLKPDFTLFLLISGLTIAGLASSCRKHEASPSTGNNHNGDSVILSTTTDEDSLKYLMYNIMQKSFVDEGRDTSYDLPTYYWYNQVPGLNPFSTQYANADSLLNNMIAHPAWNGQKVDRYSFLDRTGQVAGQVENGVVDGNFETLGSQSPYGWETTWALDNQNNSHLVVLFTDKNSPAGKAGIQRGWEITAVNGNGNVSYDGPTGANVTRVLNALYGSKQVSVTFTELNNSSTTLSLNATQYDINPIVFDTIYNEGGKKIGYFVFYIFSSVMDQNGSPTSTKTILDREFNKLSAAGINDLIVDLRYNGGGAVTTAEYLDSAIAPASAKGKVMYEYFYNDKLSTVTSQLGLDNKIYFGGGGSLNLDHVFFIVSRQTASASELTLNNLKPYMDVKLVGDTTYGKPVGFIDFTIHDYPNGQQKYLADLYAIDFATENANGVGNYYNGIVPDEAAFDYINVPWGSLQDDNLSKIFNYIKTGSFARSYSNARLADRPDLLRTSPDIPFTPHQFNGMINFQLSKKIASTALKLKRK